MNIQELRKPYPAAEIEWRVGSTNGDKTSGLALAYLTARHVMERLDEVCGPENWQDRYEFHGARTVCYLSIRIGDEWVTKADGAGDSDVEAEKGAISDALKRAAVKWGVGRYLYDLGNVWVDLEPAGRSYRIKRNQYAKLQDVLDAQFGPTKMQEVPKNEQRRPVAAESNNPAPEQPSLYKRLSVANSACVDKAAFNALWGNPATIKAQSSLSVNESTWLEKEKAKKFAELEVNEPSDYVPPSFDDLPEPTQQAVKNLGA